MEIVCENNFFVDFFNSLQNENKTIFNISIVRAIPEPY